MRAPIALSLFSCVLLSAFVAARMIPDSGTRAQEELNTSGNQDSESGPDRDGIRHNAPTHPQMITPGNFVYLGAFQLPYSDSEAETFGHGGWAMAFNPGGDADGADDGFPGSLFVLGHQIHQLVAEVNIPRPFISHTHDPTELPRATHLQPFGDVTGGIRELMTENPDQPFQIGGLQVTDDRQLHWTMYKYYNVEDRPYYSHGRSTLDLSQPNAEGPWYLGTFGSAERVWQSYKNAGYIVDIPQHRRADFGGMSHLSGLQISTGIRTSSFGPAFYAYSLPPAGTDGWKNLKATPLVWYPEEAPLDRHHPADRWTGAAWLTLGEKETIVAIGRKSLGPVYYGEARPEDCNPYKGYHGTPYEAQVLFYDPAVLRQAADGTIRPTAVMPWFRWSGKSNGGGISQYLFDDCEHYIGGVAWDSQHKLLYIAEPEGGKTAERPWQLLPLIHVFRIAEPSA